MKMYGSISAVLVTLVRLGRPVTCQPLVLLITEQDVLVSTDQLKTLISSFQEEVVCFVD